MWQQLNAAQRFLVYWLVGWVGGMLIARAFFESSWSASAREGVMSAIAVTVVMVLDGGLSQRAQDPEPPRADPNA